MASYKKKRKIQLHKKRKLPSCKKTHRRKLLPKRKQLLKRKSRGKKRMSKKILNKKIVGKKVVSKKIVSKKVVSKKAEPKYQDLKRPYDEFVVKVLRQLHKEKVPISTKAKGKMISFIRCLYNSVSKSVKSGKRSKANRTIGSLEIQNALKQVMRKKPAMELVRAIHSASRQR